ncbi:hypothetical protein AGMMS49975_00100 [Clostridia bacterium]|nr:hypothetical protein AGMMS49975_00100 [Clostridia bacterium]
MKSLKQSLMNFVIDKNPIVREEFFEVYDAKTHTRLELLAVLIRLNIKYRVLKAKKTAPAPCANGAESENPKRVPPEKFAGTLGDFGVVSFDVFDTLLFRPFASPTDLFFFVGEKLGVCDFNSIRQTSERKAREQKDEATLLDIYTEIEKITKIDREDGMRAEFETELEFIMPNPYMTEVFKHIKGKVIAISDMYLPAGMIRALLEKCGFYPDKIYVSCEYGFGKSSGELFRAAQKDFPKFCHVGDNPLADVKAPRKLGITAFYYENVNRLGKAYRAESMSLLTGSAYKGIVNTHIHNGFVYSPQYEYGYICGGLYVLGFCRFIHEYAKRHGIDKILFLARDGYIYQKVFRLMFDDIDDEYVYWSRIANMKTLTTGIYGFINYVKHVKNTKISSILSAYDLDEILPNLKNFNLSAEDVIIFENMENFEKFMYSNSGVILKKAEIQREFAKKYFSQVKNKNVCIVDVGWGGTCVIGLSRILREFAKDVNAIVAGNVESSFNVIANITPYIFSSALNRDIYDSHVKKFTKNADFFEIFTQAPHASFAGWDKNGEFIFDVEETKNYGIVKEVHEGIYDFAKTYKDVFKKYPFMYDISGHDAYMPFMTAARDIAYMKKLFGEFTISRHAGRGNALKTTLSDEINAID